MSDPTASSVAPQGRPFSVLRSPFSGGEAATLHAFILAGGRGERFWPISTFNRPKQFCTLFGGKPLIAQAVDRLAGLVPQANIRIITSADLVPATRDALPGLPAANVIGEPIGRDTAAAVALACGIVAREDPHGVALILPADPLIANEAAFRDALALAAAQAAREPVIATVGIAPTYPATGYGYIECADEAAPGVRRVRRFVEKPDLATAERYLATGAFVWNAGIFVWRADTMAAAFRAHAPQWLPLIENPTDIETLYPTLPKLSVDYAIMEKSDNLVVVRGDFGWDDVGTLPALARQFPADPQGNVAIAPTYALDAAGNIVAAEGDPRATALLGVNGLIVVHTPKATLVCSKDAAQDLKRLVATLPPDLR